MAKVKDENVEVDFERDIEISDSGRAMSRFLANYRGMLNTRMDSTPENKLVLKLAFLKHKGIKSAGEALRHYTQLKWSALGKSREEAVDVQKRVTEPKYFVGGPQGEQVKE